MTSMGLCLLLVLLLSIFAPVARTGSASMQGGTGRVEPKPTSPKTPAKKSQPSTGKGTPTVRKPRGRNTGAASRAIIDQLENELVLVPAGSFLMGSTSGNETEKPVHRVTIREPFYMGKYEVTRAQWYAVMGKNPSRSQSLAIEPVVTRDERPVDSVTWLEAVEFCRRLTQKTGRAFRLPSEAEWEYAYRAGVEGDDEPYRSVVVGSVELRFGTEPVSQTKPNAFGLHGMDLNVREWCQDSYHDSYAGAPSDGSAWLVGGQLNIRVVRGGYWSSEAHDIPVDKKGKRGFLATKPISAPDARYAARFIQEHNVISSDVGLRVVAAAWR